LTLQIHYVTRLEDVVDPVAEWVNAAPQGRPLFSTEQLLLPSNGVKAWLLPELARRVGARPGKDDGVVANVQVGYLGSLTKFIVPHRHRDIDSWSVESMTAVLLGLIVGDASLSSFVQRAGGEAFRSLPRPSSDDDPCVGQGFARDVAHHCRLVQRR